MVIGSVLDIFRMRQYFNVITRARELGAGAIDDAGFLADARRALAPLPFEGQRRPDRQVPFPPLDIQETP